MASSADAFAAFQEKWFAANPEQRIVAVFRAPQRRRLAAAFGTLVQEIENAAFDLREPQVVAAKLAWWRRELAQAGAGAAQHPVTRELVAAAGGPPAVAQVDWNALIDGAAGQPDAPPAPSFASMRSALAALYAPVAAAEARLAATPLASENVDLWTAARLLRWWRDPRRLAETTLALPLDLLARHGVTRGGLAADADARRALFAELLAAIAQMLRAALAAGAAADLGRRVRGRLDLDLATRAASQADPLQWLAGAQPPRWRVVSTAWREARIGR